MSEKDCVQVALRIRPLIQTEVSRGCKDALDIIKELQQVRLKNSDKAFTFNHVFGIETDQLLFYNECVKELIPNLFKGYNVTILAYGQTGSGKTHSMGTAYTGNEDMGVIPRAINDIFNYINDNFSYDFNVTVTFMELYQETLYDLLSTKSREECVLEIREDVNKGIFMPGITELNVTTSLDTLDCLQRGSLGRATASTNMNLQSSRSHAIFTINISMTQKGSSASNKTAKFHLVDLAGSERSKKTGATGQTFKEGVNINKGLLALGNVISALGDEKGQSSYISYRDSSLTRLLKDSLGGNSITLMIACVSPADYNVEETLSTLRYADRARKIKNKPVVNEDPKTAEINKLNKLIRQLKLELVGQGGPIICPGELELIKKELTDTKIKITNLSLRLSLTLNENAALLERILIMQASNEALTQKLKELKNEYDITVTNLNLSLDNHDVAAIKEHVMKLQTIQSQFTDIDNEQKRNEDEIRKHELSVARSTVESRETNEKEIYERQESHTAQQIAMSSQLQEVTKILAQKENLAKQIAANTCNMVDTAEIAENEAKITALEKEKDELLQQLRSVQEHQTTHGPSAKIAEQRRKRVQELESQISDLNRKVHEQARLIKLKEKDELKIRQLNNEIQNMKATRVKLIKNMRQENERFRSWKLQRERELLKLRDQDRKRQNQIVKMETIHSRQQNVLKRKVEEASAINKRLKDALALRKVAQDNKLNGKIERLGPWIQREVEVLVSTIEAKTTLDILIEDRATLQKQVDELKDEDSTSSQIQQLEEEIDLRSTQIQEIQQKVLDSDEGNKAENRFDNIQSMAEAKYTLKSLFDSIATIKRKEASKEYKINELQAAQSDLKQQVSEMSTKFKDTEAEHKDEISNLERENEEKVAVLLRQLRGITVSGVDEELKERCHIQNTTIQRLEESLEKRDQLIQELTQKLIEMESEAGTPPKRKRSKSKKLSQNNTSDDDEDIIKATPHVLFDDTFDEEEDVTHDPDWRQTPLGKRVQQLKKSQIRDNGPSKRNLRGGCTCRGTCGTRTCGCKKFATACDGTCKCAADMCRNRVKEESFEVKPLQEAVNKENVDVDSDGAEDEDEEHFKRPRSRKTRKLFSKKS